MTAFDPEQSVALASFLGHVDTVVSVHGYGRRHLRYSVLLGGRNRALAEHIATTVAPLLIDYDFVKYGSSDERKRLLQKWDEDVSTLPQ